MNAHRQPAIFIADSPGLDFLNSVATPTDEAIDWLNDGAGLLTWLEQAELVPAAALKALRASAIPGEIDNVAAQARNLREWFRAFALERIGRPLKARDLDALQPLNRLLERDEVFGQIVADPDSTTSGFEFHQARRWRSPESLLLPIAGALAKFVCDEDFTYVKACEGHACTLLFVDRTRGRARRWCSMSICGNRAKQLAHRNRKKES